MKHPHSAVALAFTGALAATLPSLTNAQEQDGRFPLSREWRFSYF